MEQQTIEITAELIEEEEGGYTVYCPELDIYTQGENVDEALANLKEAAELHIEEIGLSRPYSPRRNAEIRYAERYIEESRSFN
ncbi:MAG TPA: type II toxin-antitoxin system HicB family antitoxin [Candidatus Fraserbacteria bacterium]|nr:type II toxin-antitoxin system HicB family antitoxin [Candidatus Fraserbacteria bacterium]